MFAFVDDGVVMGQGYRLGFCGLSSVCGLKGHLPTSLFLLTLSTWMTSSAMAVPGLVSQDAQTPHQTNNSDDKKTQIPQQTSNSDDKKTQTPHQTNNSDDKRTQIPHQRANQDDKNPKLVQIRQDYHQGRYTQAAAAIESWLDSQPTADNGTPSLSKHNPAIIQELLWLLAQMHARSLGKPQNLPQALHLAREVASYGPHPQAEAYIGQAYEQGLGVSPNFQRALTWYRKAAEHGDLTLQAALGERYYLAKGVKRNLREAQHWLQLAAERGDPLCQRYLGQIFERGEGTQKRADLAFDWYARAAKQGDGVAQLALGRFYLAGIGRPKHLPKAKEYVQQAARQEVPNAAALLANLTALMACEAASVTRLYDQLLQCTQRDLMKHAITAQGGRIVRESRHGFKDHFHPGEAFPGASQLTLYYDDDARFKFAQLVYRKHQDPQLIERVYQKMQSEYGQATSKQGYALQGPKQYQWQMADGMHLRLYRHWPDTTTYFEWMPARSE